MTDPASPPPAVDSNGPPNNDMAQVQVPAGEPQPPLPMRPAASSPPSASVLSSSSTPLSAAAAARRPPSALSISQDIQARMQAFRMGRQGIPPSHRSASSPAESSHIHPSGPLGHSATPVVGPPPSGSVAGIPANLRLPGGKPVIANIHSSPAVPGMRITPKKPSLAEKRGLALPGGLPGGLPASPPSSTGSGRKKPGLTLSQLSGDSPADAKPASMMDKYSNFLDAKAGTLKFQGKAILSSQGVEFASGGTFKISLDEVDTLDELGKGNYGTVYKVRHARPRIRRPGLGLAGNRASGLAPQACSKDGESPEDHTTSSASSGTRIDGTSGAVMAMKEIRLELDDAKFAAIIMELDILHRCLSPYIIDFYGAFFQEGAVYICMEFMDGGSLDKLYGDGIPENILRKITYSTTMGLKCLKEDHNIIHRDVKPTNILMNTRGQIKICDFGVSGNLVASIAKTNIGCQSYMAPERISSGGIAMAGNPGGTYSVQSDIWSLGLTIIECAMGRYPYPPETYNNIFSQLSAIVEGAPPDLPTEGFSDAARQFVRSCLNKTPKLRPTYSALLLHPWIAPLAKPAIIEEEPDDDTNHATSPDVEDGTAVENPAAADVVPNGNAHGENVKGESPLPADAVDAEVARWVLGALARRRRGLTGRGAKPALHAAPLDAVVTPGPRDGVGPADSGVGTGG